MKRSRRMGTGVSNGPQCGSSSRDNDPQAVLLGPVVFPSWGLWQGNESGRRYVTRTGSFDGYGHQPSAASGRFITSAPSPPSSGRARAMVLHYFPPSSKEHDGGCMLCNDTGGREQ